MQSESDADIVIKDHGVADFSVCKSYIGKKIVISNYGYDLDFTIKLDGYRTSYEDILTIYNNSSLGTEEAISILLIHGSSILYKK